MNKQPFKRLNATEEAYLETIDALIKLHGTAKVTLIAVALKVKPSSVSEMLKKLCHSGYIAHKPYSNVALTLNGKVLVDYLNQQRTVLKSFFVLLGVDELTAKEDACKIEHLLHELTLKQISKFQGFLSGSADGQKCVSSFKKLCCDDKTSF